MAIFARRQPIKATELDLRRLRIALDVLIADAQAAAVADAISTISASLGTVAALDVDIDPTMATDSDSLVPSQAAVAAYVINYVAAQASALFGISQQDFCAAIGAGYTIGRQTTQLTCPGNTSENVLLAMPVPALGADAVVEVVSEWGTTANTNTKTVRIYHNTTAAAGGSLLLVTPNTSATGRTITDIRRLWGQSSTSSQRFHAASVAYSANLGSASGTAVLDVSVPTYLVFTAQKNTSAADTITLDLALARLI